MDAPLASPLVRSFERHLRAANRAPTTVATYLHAVRQAHGFLHTRGTTLETAKRADLEAFMTDLLARRAPATAATYHKVLKILYAWLVEEGEVPADPTARMRPPIVPDKPVPIVPEDGLKRLFQACAGNSFEARRDTALLMLLGRRASWVPGVPQGPGAPPGGAAVAADPDLGWRVGPGAEDGPLERPPAALERPLAAPQRPQQPDRLLGAGAAFLEAAAEVLVLGSVPANTDPQPEAAAGDLLQQGGLLGDLDWVA